MKKAITILSFLLVPFSVQADDLSEVYWSNYACGGYIYHFDSKNGKYKIYTRLDVEDKKNGKYKSYQLTEGEMKHKDGAIYVLDEGSKDVAAIDFSDMDNAIMKSAQFGIVPLIQCESESARQLIKEAERHFKTCPKNVINCTSH